MIDPLWLLALFLSVDAVWLLAALGLIALAELVLAVRACLITRKRMESEP